MHKFVRGNPPAGFSEAATQYSTWGNFMGTECHKQVRETLYTRQDRCCAYCDILLATEQEGHVEHLERRSDAPERTFDWDNLFYSCKQHDSCGKYKDESKPKILFKPADVIDPSKEDPNKFFCYDETGAVYANPNTDGTAQDRANETIRIFNLNCPRLMLRRSEVAESVAEFQEKSTGSDDERLSFLESVSGRGFPSVYQSLLDSPPHRRDA